MTDVLKLLVPAHDVRWFPEGVNCLDARDGDVWLVDHGTIPDEIISHGQRIMTLAEPELKGFTWAAHACVVRTDERGVPMVSEMGPRGYERRAVADYQHRRYAAVRFDVRPEAIATAMSYDEACSEVDYGISEYLPLIIDGIDGGRFEASWGANIICSVHTTLVMMGLGFFPDRLPSGVAPCRIAMWLGARFEG